MDATLYQLILLGDISNPACVAIRRRCFELLKERGLNGSLVAVLDGELVLAAPGTGGYESSKPSFAFYFGKPDHGDKDIAAIEKLKGNADAIFPIYFQAGRFHDEVPEELWTANGRLFELANLDSIVNVALEELRLLRKTRRVFISYKRSESLAVANQLYDVLSHNQFDVFLDTYSIRGSADFQAELKHRITDSDVLVQLNSARFMDSKWCMEEISEANAHQVGVLQVNWPGIHPGENDQLSVTMMLRDVDFRRRRYKRNSSTLKASVLKEIAAKVEAIRARNIAARQDGLTAEFVKEAARQERSIIKEPMFLVEQRTDKGFWYYIPAIGVPQSLNFQESLKMLSRWGVTMPERVFLIYDDLSVLPQWVEHLDWISDYLEVKTIKKQEFALWLQKTKKRTSFSLPACLR